MKLNIVKTPQLSVFIFSSKSKPKYNKTFTFNNSHINFELAASAADTYVKVIRNGGKITKTDFHDVEELHDVVRTLASWTNGLLTIDGTSVLYEGKEIGEDLQEYLLEIFTTKGADGVKELESWSNFIAAINRSDSYKVMNRLFMFLKQNDLTITEDGFVLCWKVVRPDYFDKHSGTIDYSVGKTVTIPRGKVDDNDNNYCSHGLHVCSWNYLKSFANTGDPVMSVKIDPKDILSIPLDYAGEKIRVCSMEVMEEVGKWNESVSAQRIPTLGVATRV